MWIIFNIFTHIIFYLLNCCISLKCISWSGLLFEEGFFFQLLKSTNILSTYKSHCYQPYKNASYTTNLSLFSDKAFLCGRFNLEHMAASLSCVSLVPGDVEPWFFLILCLCSWPLPEFFCHYHRRWDALNLVLSGHMFISWYQSGLRVLVFSLVNLLMCRNLHN